MMNFIADSQINQAAAMAACAAACAAASAAAAG